MQSASGIVARFVQYVINPAMTLLFAAGFFMFTYGLVRFLWAMNEGGSDKKDGQQHMIWGIVGMLIMVSVYGIISLIDNTFDLQINNPDVSRIQNVSTGANLFGY